MSVSVGFLIWAWSWHSSSVTQPATRANAVHSQIPRLPKNSSKTAHPLTQPDSWFPIFLCPLLGFFSRSKTLSSSLIEWLCDRWIWLPLFNRHGFAGWIEDALHHRRFDLSSSKHRTRILIVLLLRLFWRLVLLPGPWGCSLGNRFPSSCAGLLRSGLPELRRWEAKELRQHFLLQANVLPALHP